MSANIFLVSSLAILCPMYDLKDDSISCRTSGEKRLFSFFWSFKAISRFFLLQQSHITCFFNSNGITSYASMIKSAKSHES